MYTVVFRMNESFLFKNTKVRLIKVDNVHACRSYHRQAVHKLHNYVRTWMMIDMRKLAGHIAVFGDDTPMRYNFWAPGE